MGDVYPNGYPLQNPYSQPSGGGSTAGGTAAPWYQQPWVYNAADLFLTGAATYAGASSAKEANRKNIQLQREQQAWEKNMSDTAVQRRADDIEKAGGNRALAFTNGQSASTPSVAPAAVNPTFRPEWIKSGTAAQALTTATQIENMRANTAQQLAQARITNVEADIREHNKTQELAARLNEWVEKIDWDDLKTEIMRNTKSQSAADAERTKRQVDDLVTQVRNEARTSTLTTEKLENLFKATGLDKDSGWLKAIFSQLAWRYMTK